jgi:hypothetical protein
MEGGGGCARCGHIFCGISVVPKVSNLRKANNTMEYSFLKCDFFAVLIPNQS